MKSILSSLRVTLSDSHRSLEFDVFFLLLWQRLSYYTLIGAFLISTMSYVISGGDGQVAWGGMLLLSFVAFERVSGF